MLLLSARLAFRVAAGVPHQTAGKIVASFLLLGGLALLAVVTALVTSAFVTQAQAEGKLEADDRGLQRPLLAQRRSTTVANSYGSTPGTKSASDVHARSSAETTSVEVFRDSVVDGVYILDCPAFDTELRCADFYSETSIALDGGKARTHVALVCLAADSVARVGFRLARTMEENRTTTLCARFRFRTSSGECVNDRLLHLRRGGGLVGARGFDRVAAYEPAGGAQRLQQRDDRADDRPRARARGRAGGAGGDPVR